MGARRPRPVPLRCDRKRKQSHESASQDREQHHPRTAGGTAHHSRALGARRDIHGLVADDTRTFSPCVRHYFTWGGTARPSTRTTSMKSAQASPWTRPSIGRSATRLTRWSRNLPVVPSGVARRRMHGMLHILCQVIIGDKPFRFRSTARRATAGGAVATPARRLRRRGEV